MSEKYGIADRTLSVSEYAYARAYRYALNRDPMVGSDDSGPLLVLALVFVPSFHENRRNSSEIFERKRRVTAETVIQC
jgi:hypothetical protein